jgi:hypothetical protein
MSDQELSRLRDQIAADRKLIEQAAQALAEIDRSSGLQDHQADVLASLRIRLEGRERATLEDLLSAAGDIGAKQSLGDVLNDEPDSREWPEVKEKKKDWPGL